MFDDQLALAGRGWRVVAPQLRRFDGGAGDPAAASIDDYAADAIDLLDALHVEEAVIGGVSMGGYIAFAMLRQAPRYFQDDLVATIRVSPIRAAVRASERVSESRRVSWVAGIGE